MHWIVGYLDSCRGQFPPIGEPFSGAYPKQANSKENFHLLDVPSRFILSPPSGKARWVLRSDLPIIPTAVIPSSVAFASDQGELGLPSSSHRENIEELL